MAWSGGCHSFIVAFWLIIRSQAYPDIAPQIDDLFDHTYELTYKTYARLQCNALSVYSPSCA